MNNEERYSPAGETSSRPTFELCLSCRAFSLFAVSSRRLVESATTFWKGVRVASVIAPWLGCRRRPSSTLGAVRMLLFPAGRSMSSAGVLFSRTDLRARTPAFPRSPGSHYGATNTSYSLAGNAVVFFGRKCRNGTYFAALPAEYATIHPSYALCAVMLSYYWPRPCYLAYAPRMSGVTSLGWGSFSVSKRCQQYHRPLGPHAASSTKIPSARLLHHWP